MQATHSAKDTSTTKSNARLLGAVNSIMMMMVVVHAYLQWATTSAKLAPEYVKGMTMVM
jgi:hypothetical protein